MEMFDENATIGEIYGPAMEIKDYQEAQEYLRMLIDRQKKYWHRTEEEAMRIEMMNIGYYAGYYDAETAERVYKLFDTAHPFFGTTTPTLEEAIITGMQMAKKDL